MPLVFQLFVCIWCPPSCSVRTSTVVALSLEQDPSDRRTPSLPNVPCFFLFFFHMFFPWKGTRNNFPLNFETTISCIPMSPPARWVFASVPSPFPPLLCSRS